MRDVKCPYFRVFIPTMRSTTACVTKNILNISACVFKSYIPELDPNQEVRLPPPLPSICHSQRSLPRDPIHRSLFWGLKVQYRGSYKMGKLLRVHDGEDDRPERFQEFPLSFPFNLDHVPSRPQPRCLFAIQVFFISHALPLMCNTPTSIPRSTRHEGVRKAWCILVFLIPYLGLRSGTANET